MGFVTSSELIVRFAVWASFAVFSISLLLTLVIVGLRIRLMRRLDRRRWFMDTWRPVLMLSLVDVPGELPPVARRDAFHFLNYWNHLHESLRGEAKERLNRVARRAGIDAIARRMIERRRLRERLMAVATLGHLRDAESWERLYRLARARHGLLSLTAMRALVQIDARAAMPLLMQQLARRDDWPRAKVESILREAGPDAVSRPLADTITRLPPQQAAALIPYLDVARSGVAAGVIRRFMSSSHDDRMISACLQVIDDPRDLDLVRAQLGHERWHIRVQAATTLGRLGGREDVARIERLLGDEQWWVRYRAAQALASLPFLDVDGLRALHARQTDRYARDILAQVIAEQQLP